MLRKFLIAAAISLAGCSATTVIDSSPNGPADAYAGESNSVATSRLSLDAPTTAPAFASLFSCPMHASVIADHPGKCPICGMSLEPKTGGK